MTIIRQDTIGADCEMKMKLVHQHNSFFVQSSHTVLPFLVGFRRINCDDQAQAERAYERGLEASSAALMTE
jgi:hypothetical protein